MSGPKSSSYTLTDAIIDALDESQAQRQREESERLRRQAKARARAEAARLAELARQDKLKRLRASHREMALSHERLRAALSSDALHASGFVLPDIPVLEDESADGLTTFEAAQKAVARQLAEADRLVVRAGVSALFAAPGIGAAETVGEMLDRFAAAHVGAGVKEAIEVEATHSRAVMDRIVGGLKEVSPDELPASLESLLQQAASASNAARFDMLCMEMRLQVQRHNERVRQRQAGRRAAEDWLTLLTPIDVEGQQAHFREELSDVAQGIRPWDDDMGKRAQLALDDLQADAQRRQDRVAARILEGALRDMGYEVEGIAQTLFAEGGAVHFQAKGWGDHFMRLKVIPERDALHFNMVRSADSESTSGRDMELERQWCQSYPALMQMLADRGIKSTPLRAVGAGTYPVEAVSPKVLPKKAVSSSAQEVSRPLQRAAESGNGKP